MTDNSSSATCGALLRRFREQATPTAEELRLRRQSLAAQVDGLTTEEMLLRVTRRRGLTQEELVARCGLSVEGLRKIERDRVSPLDDTILLLARALRLTDSEREMLLASAGQGRAKRMSSRPAGVSAMLRTSDRTRPPLGGATRLPAQLTSFVGRKEAVSRLLTMLQPQLERGQALSNAGSCRLLTLTGPGGSGKTRLALAVAAQVERVFADGVRLVELASLPAAGAGVSSIEQAMATALGLAPRSSQSSLATLITVLQDRELLLVLDNVEHLVTACRSPVAALLRACPGLRILATSREALGIAGEWTWPVPPLSLPEDVADGRVGTWEQSESVALFVERARARVPGFTLDAGTGEMVAAICRRLDGLPLAIELAVARLPVLSLGDLAARLDDRFALLSRGNAAAPPRQQTLRATLDWSYRLLTPSAAILLGRLAPFAGGWTFAVAAHVCSDTTLPESAVPDALTELVEHSLAQVDPVTVTGAETVRHSMLETIRDYARRVLIETEGAAQARSLQLRHLAWCIELVVQPENQSMCALPAEETRVQDTSGEHELQAEVVSLHSREIWLRALQPEEDNLRTALGFALAEPACIEQGLQLAAALWPFWLGQGSLREGRRWLALALAASRTKDWQQTTPAVLRKHEPLYRSRAAALYGAGRLAAQQGAQAQAQALLGEHSALCRALHNALAVSDSTA
jgi:non-specific serine/threonine protein kinase